MALVMLIFLWRAGNPQARRVDRAGRIRLSVGLMLDLTLAPLGLLAGLIVIEAAAHAGLAPIAAIWRCSARHGVSLAGYWL